MFLFEVYCNLYDFLLSSVEHKRQFDKSFFSSVVLEHTDFHCIH